MMNQIKKETKKKSIVLERVKRNLNNKHLLKGIRIYLSGPIEFSKNDGVDLRQKFINKCKLSNLKFNFLDPTDKDDTVVGEIAEEREKMRKLKASGQFKKLTEKMKKVRRWDLRAVDLSHCIVVFINKDIPTWGTQDELKVGETQRKPIFAVVAGGPKNCPDWVFTQIRHEDMFDSIEGLVDHLNKLNCGKIELDDRWILIGR